MPTVAGDQTADTTVEADETAIMTVAAGSGYTVGSPSSDTGTIHNDDTIVSVAATPAEISTLSLHDALPILTRAGVTSGALTINFALSGTAGTSGDYTVSGAASY